MIAQTFSRGYRRLIQPYLYKFVEMILRVHIQFNMAEISSNRIPQNLEIKLIDLYFLKTFFSGLICQGEVGNGYSRGSFYLGYRLNVKLVNLSAG